jgi:hypothetical protein
MKFAMGIRKAVICCVLIASLFVSGCSNALFMQDWMRDLTGFVMSTGIGFLTNALLSFTSVRVERTCFENGVQVDCSTLPGGG